MINPETAHYNENSCRKYHSNTCSLISEKMSTLMLPWSPSVPPITRPTIGHHTYMCEKLVLYMVDHAWCHTPKGTFSHVHELRFSKIWRKGMSSLICWPTEKHLHGSSLGGNLACQRRRYKSKYDLWNAIVAVSKVWIQSVQYVAMRYSQLIIHTTDQEM